MCLILLAHQYHPKYRLVFAANRDEFPNRPTAPAAFWEEDPNILAGKDLLKGGTWCGVSKIGRFAALANIRDPKAHRDGAPSRGLLVSNFLKGKESSEEYLQKIEKEAREYNPFGLLAGDKSDLFYFSNRVRKSQKLEPGLYGLSNHLLDTPWPKVKRGKGKLKAILSRESFSAEDLLDLLADTTPARDSELPDTGVGLELERMLSPIFIKSPTYGTRASTIILIDTENNVTFIEKTAKSQKYQFKLQ
ncbi:MAG: NRDE family protein [Deltaproteobacteria bacterium]|nr:NRDE family protein [Deltaproteobacteria bacterium]